MQSDRNRFCCDVVLDSLNISSDEDSIWDQIYKDKIFLYLYYEDLNFQKILQIPKIKQHSTTRKS